jgi:hypothetical protein
LSEYFCINCGKDLGPGVALTRQGGKCPSCLLPWEGRGEADVLRAAQLRDAGVITTEQFEAKKRRILERS